MGEYLERYLKQTRRDYGHHHNWQQAYPQLENSVLHQKDNSSCLVMAEAHLLATPLLCERMAVVSCFING